MISDPLYLRIATESHNSMDTIKYIYASTAECKKIHSESTIGDGITTLSTYSTGHSQEILLNLN